VPSPLGPEQQPAFTVDTVASDGGIVLRAGGELDMATVDRLRAHIDDAIKDAESIELDMTGVTFIDSTGLRALIMGREAAAAAGREFGVVPSDAVRKLVELAGLTEFIPLRSGGETDGTRAA
jgi:anti-sigma B factor antagonist